MESQSSICGMLTYIYSIVLSLLFEFIETSKQIELVYSYITVHGTDRLVSRLQDLNFEI